MNEHLKEIILKHGLHKHISEDCQSRMEFLYETVVKECIERIEQAAEDSPELYGVALDLQEHFGIE